MNKKKSIVIVFLLAIVMIFSINGKVNAVASISGNTVSGKAGENIAVTFTTSTNIDTLQAQLGNYSDCLEFQSLTASNALSNGKIVSATSAQTNYGKVVITARFKIKSGVKAQTAKVTLNVSELYEKGSDTNYAKSATATVTVQEAAQGGSTGGNTEKPVTPPVDEPTPTLSSDATLKDLKVAEGSLSPKFSSTTMEYKLSVDNGIDSIKVTATKNNSKAKVSISGEDNLKVGRNKVKIKVTAEDGTTKTYVIVVDRQADKSGIVTNIDEQELFLTSLKVIGAELTPEFSPNNYSYECQVGEKVEKLEIEAVANIEGTIVTISGNDKLISGENIITILLKSADGTKEVTYQIKAIKEKAQEVIQAVSNVEVPQEVSSPRWNTTQKILITIFTSIIAIMGIAFAVIEYRDTKKKQANQDKEEQEEYPYGMIDYTQEEETISEEGTKTEQEEDENEIDKIEEPQQEDRKTQKGKNKGKHF